MHSVTTTFNILSLKPAITQKASDKNVVEVVLGRDMDTHRDNIGSATLKRYTDTHAHVQ